MMTANIRKRIAQLADAQGVRSPRIVSSDAVYWNVATADAYLRSAVEGNQDVAAVRVLDTSSSSRLPQRYRDLITKALRLQERLCGWSANGIRRQALARAKAGRCKTRGCGECGARYNVQNLLSATCSTCGHDFLLTKQDRASLEVAERKLSETTSAIERYISSRATGSVVFAWRVAVGGALKTLRNSSARPERVSIDSIPPAGLCLHRLGVVQTSQIKLRA